ncbi:MAG: terpene cyclase/mutase family protein [Nitrospirae bacterium]|nr:terpene cyclase/mutase family protein [Nitrospirota bacterium]
MSRSSLGKIAETSLSRRLLPDGGFVGRLGGTFQVDSTAWGILAFRGAGGEQDILEKHRARLIREQGEDGRVWVHREHSESYWPTALAILAWQNSPPSQAAQGRAIRFLLETTGAHRPRQSDEPAGHDTLLRGWPWVGGTHSWIEPTALAVIALKDAGHGQHDRVREAIRMILDRQLPHGGWNYGNTLVFGRELHPMPESTGAALTGLAGVVDQEKVARSISYLQGEVDRLRTPVSLGWALLGLAAWDLWPPNGAALVERCLANQSRYGEYDTSALCLLFLGALAGETDTKTNLFLHTSRKQAPAALTQ